MDYNAMASVISCDCAGVDGFDFIVEIVQHKHRVAAAVLLSSSRQLQSPSVDHSTTNHSTAPTPATTNTARLDETANQRKKREQREERELQAAIHSSLKDDDGSTNHHTGTIHHHPDWLKQLGFSDEYLLVERSLGLQKGGADSRARPENWLDDLAPEGKDCHTCTVCTLAL